MHRRLKAALVVRRSSTSWPSELPLVLLGLRSAPLETSGVSSAELLNGTPTSLPGQFLSILELPLSEFLDELHSLVDTFVPGSLVVHGSSQPSGKVHLPPLWEAGFVFVCRDGFSPALSSLYDGPYRVISRLLPPGLPQAAVSFRPFCSSSSSLAPFSSEASSPAS